MTPGPLPDRSVARAHSIADTCSWIVTVKNGEAVELRGDAAHPTPADRRATREPAGPLADELWELHFAIKNSHCAE